MTNSFVLDRRYSKVTALCHAHLRTNARVATHVLCARLRLAQAFWFPRFPLASGKVAFSMLSRICPPSPSPSRSPSRKRSRSRSPKRPDTDAISPSRVREKERLGYDLHTPWECEGRAGQAPSHAQTDCKRIRWDHFKTGKLKIMEIVEAVWSVLHELDPDFAYIGVPCEWLQTFQNLRPFVKFQLPPN